MNDNMKEVHSKIMENRIPNGAQIMIVDDQGGVQLTPGMAERVQFVEQPASVRVVELA